MSTDGRSWNCQEGVVNKFVVLIFFPLFSFSCCLFLRLIVAHVPLNRSSIPLSTAPPILV